MRGLIEQGAAMGGHEEHLGAYLEAAVDSVIMADVSGRVVEFTARCAS
jgi:hypothetical protein